jgi:Transposase DDE domain group 1
VPTHYHRIAWDGAKIEALFIDLLLGAHRSPPPQMIFDLDATDDPLHGHQEDRFFHGYYDGYCYAAALHFLRFASVGVKAAARRHRWRRQGREGHEAGIGKRLAACPVPVYNPPSVTPVLWGAR